MALNARGNARVSNYYYDNDPLERDFGLNVF